MKASAIEVPSPICFVAAAAKVSWTNGSCFVSLTQKQSKPKASAFLARFPASAGEDTATSASIFNR